jgi:hypothetical protein
MKIYLIINQILKADNQLKTPAVAKVGFQQGGIFEHFLLDLKIVGNQMLDLLR